MLNVDLQQISYFSKTANVQFSRASLSHCHLLYDTLSVECPIEGQVYYGGDSCAPCDGTCEQPLVVCPLICRRGCGCPRGQVIDQAQNRCVALSECPSK